MWFLLANSTSQQRINQELSKIEPDWHVAFERRLKRHMNMGVFGFLEGSSLHRVKEFG